MAISIKSKRKIHPKEGANIFSQLSFFYVLSLFRKGYRKDLTQDDLYEVLSTCKSKTLGDALEVEWEIERKTAKNPSIMRILWRCFGKTYVLFGLMQLVMRTIFVMIIPEALGKLVSFFTPGQTDLTKTDAYYYAAAVIIFNVINFIYTHNYMMAITEYGIRIRTALCSLIFRKTMRMTEAALAKETMGKIVTLITKDLFAIEMLVLFGNDVWIGLVQTVLISYLIYRKIGVATFAGVGFLVAILPLQIFIGKLATIFRLRTSKKTDERLQQTQETLSAMKIIKMYAWEPFFRKKIKTSRKKEINIIYKLFYMKVIMIVIGGLSLKIGFYFLIMTYVWLGNFVTAEIVYFINSCFGKLRHLLSIMVPLGIAFGAEFYATYTRLKTLLEAEEVPLPQNSTSVVKEPKIVFDNATAVNHQVEIFKNLSLVITRGLTVIQGHVGNGKTTFLKTILQNYQIYGNFSVYGEISYASQEPWLFPASIKDNILFGADFNRSRYERVLQVCALNPDLKNLDQGDETIVGDNGMNLSKGQQARVNLARAVYKDCEIYLLDDSLAALDGRVSDHVFRRCIRDFLRDKLCLFVTNNEKHAQLADEIIEVNRGLIRYVKKTNIEAKDYWQGEVDESLIKDSPKTEVSQIAPEVKDFYQETKKSGHVTMATYQKYVQFGGGYIIFFLIMVMFVVVQGAVSYSDKLVSEWVTVEQNLSSYNRDNLTNSTDFMEKWVQRSSLLNLYTIIIIAATILSLAKSLCFFAFNCRASIFLHKVMLEKILGAKMRFFDSHFIGNVLNRFSKDLCTVDEHLPFLMNECFELAFVFIGILSLVAFANTIFLVPIAIFFILANIVRHVFQRTGRNLQRLDAATRSPIIGHLNASLEGLATIRAFNAEEMIINQFDERQDLYTSANYTLQNSMRALGFILDGMCSCFIGLVIGRFLLIPSDTTVGNVGLAISQAFHLTGLLQYGIRRIADFDNQMTSVERILEYTEIEQEDKKGEVVESWPQNGKICFDSVSLCYGATKVLKNMTFQVNPKEKLGVIGRTGAGKSSIISSLFRLYDIDGKITIDGVNIKDLSLEFLRSNIAIIPQDPVIFSGTVRDNIDPLHKLEDEEIWKIIKVTRLQDTVSSLSDQMENNMNFSVGQKQLICLARALARKNKVIMLDEATANLDPETDALVRSVIEESFADCTVIIIAHRLASVLAADVVMVVNDGQIVEKDNPDKLLELNDGLFLEMVKQS